MIKRLHLKLVRENARIPTRETFGSVGYDLYASLDEPVTLTPGGFTLIPAGFCLSLEQGYAAFIYARSGLGVKQGIVPRNCVGVIDSDYRGEIKIGLVNNSSEAFTVKPFDRIAQMVICQCELPELILVDELDPTVRNENGFGSTQ